MQSFSGDLIHWETPWNVLVPDEKDEGETQFYAMAGFINRGDMLIGLVKVLRDELHADPEEEGHGVGYTTLAYTRDGVHWTRDHCSPRAAASALARCVLPNPGKPSIST